MDVSMQVGGTLEKGLDIDISRRLRAMGIGDIKVGLVPEPLQFHAYTLPNTNMDRDNGHLEGCFPLPTSVVFSGSMLVFQSVTSCIVMSSISLQRHLRKHQDEWVNHGQWCGVVR